MYRALLLLAVLPFLSYVTSIPDALVGSRPARWVIRVTGGNEEADRVAKKYGLENRGKVPAVLYKTYTDTR